MRAMVLGRWPGRSRITKIEAAFHATYLSPFIWSQEPVALATDDWRCGSSVSRERLIRIGRGDELLRLDDSVPCSATAARAQQQDRRRQPDDLSRGAGV